MEPSRPPTELFKPPVTSPVANEVLIEALPPCCSPTSPPMLAAFCRSLLLPAVTLPDANELVIVPKLKPTSPPAPAPVPSETLTLPLASDRKLPLILLLPKVPMIVPLLVPTSPPTKVKAPPLTLPVATESVMVARLLPTAGLLPTSPPAMLLLEPLVELPTLTFAPEDEFVIVPI